MALIAVAAAVIVFAPEIAAFLAPVFGSAVTAAAIVSVGISIGLSAALSLGQQVFASKPGSVSATPTTYRQVIANTQIIYGKARTGGLICFYHANKVGKLDYRYFVIAIAGHQINGVTSYYLNDETVSVDGSGAVVSGKYAGHAWIWPDLGAIDATANATFVAETDGMWTAAHRGQGVAKLYVKFELTDAIIAEGFPNITVEVEGKNDIVDPRDDSTGYTNNAILCSYDWLRTARLDGGFGAVAEEVDDDFVSAQANICDEAVALTDGGTEPRYTCDGLITTGAAPDGIRDALLTSFAGEFTYSAGQFKMYAGAWRPPTLSLVEDDLVAGLNVSPLATGDTIANEVRGTFNDPAQKYQPQEYPSITLATGDDLRTMDADLPFTKSVTACQRISKIMLLRANAERSVTWPMNMRGIEVEALDTLQLATSRYGLSNYSWKAMGWAMGADFAVTLQLKEESPDFYDWVPATDQQTPLPPAAPITTPVAIDVGGGGAPTSIDAVRTSTTTADVTFIMPDTDSVVGYEIYRGTLIAFSSATLVKSDVAGPSMAISDSVIGLAPSTGYRIWARARLGTGAYSPVAGPVSLSTEP